jgi:PPP family 3-phenylpropionic acid transporter
MLRGRHTVIAAYFCVFWILGVWMPYFPLYLLHLGYDGRQIGMVAALQPGLRWSSAILWAYGADRWRIRHRLLVIAALGGALCYAPLLFVERFAAVVAVTGAIALLHGALVPMLDATVMDHLPRLGGDYGRIRMWGSIAFVLGSLVSAPLIQLLSPVLVPVLLFIGAVALVPALVWVPTEQFGRVEHFRAPWSLLTPPLSAFLLTAFLIQLSCGAWTGFFAVHTAALGFSNAVPGITWGLAVTAEVVLLFWGQRVVEWISPSRIILWVLVITVARWSLTAVARNEVLVVALQIGHAFTFSAFHLAALLLLSRLVPAENSTGGQALYGLMAFGVGGSVGLGMAGVLVDTVGTSGLFACEALVASFGFIPAFFLRRLASGLSALGVRARRATSG